MSWRQNGGCCCCCCRRSCGLTEPSDDSGQCSRRRVLPAHLLHPPLSRSLSPVTAAAAGAFHSSSSSPLHLLGPTEPLLSALRRSPIHSPPAESEKSGCGSQTEEEEEAATIQLTRTGRLCCLAAAAATHNMHARTRVCEGRCCRKKWMDGWMDGGSVRRSTGARGRANSVACARSLPPSHILSLSFLPPLSLANCESLRLLPSTHAGSTNIAGGSEFLPCRGAPARA